MRYGKKPKRLNTTTWSRAADLWEGTMWKGGHGRGHENSQGATHMEMVGIMNGSALIRAIHESSIKGDVVESADAAQQTHDSGTMGTVQRSWNWSHQSCAPGHQNSI